MVSRIEALADAVSKNCGWHDPQSDAYKTRNPGLLPAISPKHARSEKGYRVFAGFIDGYQALLFDLAVKCSGRSNTRLRPDSTLTELMNVYGHPSQTASYVAKFLKHALDEDVTPETPLSYFVTAS